ncbi:MAG: (d)CMP kinase [Alphaproteobacteria bacterium]|nr:(d)CMP kinase [Alphaproteobacteria bacterium]
MTKPVIAIDGPAASGKGTLARALAHRLDFGYLDTGALYRLVGYSVLERGQNPADHAQAAEAAYFLRDYFTPDLLNNPDLRNDASGNAASKVATMPEVRKALLDLQQNFASNPGGAFKGAILDGRDIGTVICPEAPLKLFITAAPEIRAQRRLKELQSRGIEATYEAVLKDMLERDARDTARKTAPMKPADDAIIIDSSHISAAEMLEKALDTAMQRLGLSA